MKTIDGRRSYVAGRWVEGERSFEVENPADESCFGEASVTPLPEVQRAISEARRSFDQGVWADLPLAERAKILHAFLDHVEASQEILIDTIMGEGGEG
jgi:aldehyde dehydrogenase (NAD+)